MSDKGVPTSFEFTEDMKGFVTFGETNYEDGYSQGKAAGNFLMFHVAIRTDDVDRFATAPNHEAAASGYVRCARLGGDRPVEKGVFHLFVDTADLNRKKMKYRLFFRDANGQPLTLSGFKSVQDNVGPDVWKDTTTLFTNLYHGHVSADQEASTEILAAGILQIEMLDFLKELTTMRTQGPTFAARARGAEQFGRLFLGSLWDVYGPSVMPKMQPYEREIPLHTTEGVKDADISIHPFATADKLGLSLLRFLRQPCDDVLVLIHGLTTSSDMFIMPEHYNLVSYLLGNGFTDVWTLDFRMSNRFPYNLRRHRFNMDDCALYDYPPALAKVRDAIGPNRRIHVICHCLGSVSFMMSLFGKAVRRVSSVISNSVSLTPRVPLWSRLKLTWAPFMSDYVLGVEYLNPLWRREPGFSPGKLLAWFVSLYHRECNVPECHFLSFMWGTGWPALYNHENLLDVTHRRGGDLYGGNSVHYYRHVRKMVAASNTAVKYDPRNPKYKMLPDNYFQHAAEIETPVLLVTGERNNIFRDSNIVCHERLQKVAPGRHELKVYPNYGHQDVFMGKNVAIDVFPRMLEFLNKHRTPGRVRVAVPAAGPEFRLDGGERTTMRIQTFRDRKLALWQSVVEEVAARQPAAEGALAAAAKHPNREALLGHPLVASATALAQFLNASQARQPTPRQSASLALAQALNAGATPLTVRDAAAASLDPATWRCGKLALQLAWAKAKADRHEIERLENELRFSSCDPLWAECVNRYLAYFTLQKGSIPYRCGDDYVLDCKPSAQARIALIADWGTGTTVAAELLREIAARKPEVLFHLGDIYYSGTETEVAQFLSTCRQVLDPQTRIFTLAGNHDMYSGGAAYYHLVDQLGQKASYFCLRNDDWQFLAMDTGYNDFDPIKVDSNVTHLTPTEAAWHRDKLQNAGGRKTVLLSHHQLFSAYDPIGGQAVNTDLKEQFDDLLDRVSIWFWGHEHSLSIYAPFQGLARGRCIGCAAIPVFVEPDYYQPKFPEVPLVPDPADVTGTIELTNDGTIYNHAYAIVELNGANATVSYYQKGVSQPLYVEAI